MVETRKAKVNRLASEIRGRATDPTAHAVKELLGLLLDDAKDNLVSSGGNQTLLLQGEAQALQRLIAQLTKEPANIKRQGE